MKLATLSLLWTSVVLTALPVQALPGRPFYPRRMPPVPQQRPTYPTNPNNLPPTYQPSTNTGSTQSGSNSGNWGSNSWTQPQTGNSQLPGPTQPGYTPATNTTSTTNPIISTYRTAEQELPQDYYVLYRVVDRLARANGLDNYAWRVAITSQYDDSAFATEVNRINIYNGVIDQLYGDLDGLACAVGHEMAHNTQRQLASQDAQRATIYNQLAAFAKGQPIPTATIGSTTTSNTTTNTTTAGNTTINPTDDNGEDELTSAIGRSIVSQVASMVGGIPGTLIANVVTGILNRETNRQNQPTTGTMIPTNNPTQDNPLATLLHEYEFEADALAYQYTVRAGFDSQGCNRSTSILARLNAGISQHFPSSADRLTRLATLPSQFSSTTLTAEGEAKLRNSVQPLQYSLIDNQTALRISRNSWSNLDSRFPNSTEQTQAGALYPEEAFYPIQWGEEVHE